MVHRKWFLVVDAAGRTVASSGAAWVSAEDVATLRAAVAGLWRTLLARVPAEQLSVYANGEAFARGDAPLASDDAIVAFGNSIETPLHVIAPTPVGPRAPPPPVPDFKLYGSYENWHQEDDVGIDLNDHRATLPRRAKTQELIALLDRRRVAMVKTPPMTGKTALAALVCEELARRGMEEQRVVVAAFSLASVRDDETMFDAFERECGAKWHDVMDLADEDYAVYVVLDEAQLLDDWNKDSPPSKNSGSFWRQIKGGRPRVRVLMLGTYGSNVQYAGSGIYTEIPDDCVPGIEYLRFDADEIHAYVAQCFHAIASLGVATEQFCALLGVLTDGHAGLCVAAVRALNAVYGRRKHEITAREWLDMLHSGCLDGREHALTDALAETRAARELASRWGDVGGSLEHLLNNTNWGEDEEHLDACVRCGILTRFYVHQLAFASPVMGRYVVEKCVQSVPRLEAPTDNVAPATLEELIMRSFETIDYGAVRRAVLDRPCSYISLETTWHMQFYVAVYRCTPAAFHTSADVGSLFGSHGFLELTVRSDQGDVWGIEWVPEDDRLEDHIARFAADGLYASLQLTDHCVVAFTTRVATSMEEPATMESLKSASMACERLFLVCHDPYLSRVHVWHRGEVTRVFGVGSTPRTAPL